MKVFALLLAGALAADPPRIELDLAQMVAADGVELLQQEISYSHTHNDNLYNTVHAMCTGTPAACGTHHSQGACDASAGCAWQAEATTPVGSRQDWVERCKAGPTQDISTCPFPIARAYDHHDHDLSDQVSTRVYLTDVDGNSCTTVAGRSSDCDCDDASDAQCQVTSVDFTRRSTYLFKYDVTDNAGNHAEQVVFALVLDDACGSACNPQIVPCGTAAETWEAASASELCTGAQATDNIDLDVTDRMQYDVVKLDGDAEISTECKDESYQAYLDWHANPANPTPCATTALATDSTGRFLVILHVEDRAGFYGANAQNNRAEMRQTVVISDTTAPVIQIQDFNPEYQQCHYRDATHATCASNCTAAFQHDASCTSDYTGNFDHDDCGHNAWMAADPTAQSCRCTGAACCHKYIDAGVIVSDLLDTETNGADISGECTGTAPFYGCLSTTGYVDSSTPGTYHVFYNAWDTHGNKAEPRNRTVVVEDTVAPWIKLNPAQGEVVQHYARSAASEVETINDSGALCSDDCDRSTLTATAVWDRTFNDTLLGNYIRTYTCEDAAGKKASITRTFAIVDSGAPTIQVQGDNPRTVAASVTAQYVDEGATCSDYVDGTLSHAVEVSGQVVNLRVPGTYTIKYDCQDLAGNNATQLTRTVVVEDNDCPRVNLTGPAHQFVEAGFDFIDAGATATDDLDGDITDHITTSGDSVDTSTSFYSRRSCREIKTSFPGATSAFYYITVLDTGGQFARRRVYCDMASALPDSSKPGFTYYLCENCASVVPYTAGGAQGDCGTYGLAMAVWTADEESSRDHMEANGADWGNTDASFWPSDWAALGATNNYLCSTNDALVTAPTHAGWPAADHVTHGKDVPHDEITHAEQGKYIIFYHVQDAAGNDECQPTPTRTVVVKDTLPPVISLHVYPTDTDTGNYPSTYVHQGAGGVSSSQTGSVANPAATSAGGNSFLPATRRLAEQPGGDAAWAHRSAAVAVAGAAMLALVLTRKQQQPVIVDV